MNDRQAQQLAEAFKLQTKARQWFADLATAGVSEAAAMSAMQTAIIETIIANHGQRAGVQWFKAQLELVDQHGEAMERELRKGRG